ncbi:MAG: hypothetical protein ABSH14_03885 [Verrucomicrobiia bacterium]|jgi:hypothetical protein
MKKTTVTIALLFVTGLLTAALGESVVTLKSGEVLRGDVVSDTNDVLQIRAFSANRTISSLRNVPHADIQNIYNETPAEAAERIDFFALSKFQLNPDQEQSTEFYTQWIDAFGKFLKTYPQSDKTTVIQQRIEACQSELKHVADGEVKFENRWMTPVEKKPLSLAKQLADLERQRDSLAKTVAAAQGTLAGLQAILPTFFDVHGRPIGDYQEPIYGTRDDGSPNHFAVRYIAGYRTVQNPQRVKVQADIVSVQQQVASGGQALANLDAKIQGIKIQISQAQRAYEIALAKASQKPAPVIAAPPPPAHVAEPVVAPPVATPPVVVAPKPGIARYWKEFAVGGGVLVILLLLIYPLKRFLQRSEQTEAERDEQRRVARDNLKKVFDNIFAEGEKPAGPNTPDGEIVPIGRGEDTYGGGRWFVIGDSYIWAVQNNGRPTDNWVYNNVVTKGHGAVGARIPIDTELADYINTEAIAAR